MEIQTEPAPPSQADRIWYGRKVQQLLPDLYGRAFRLCPQHADAEDLVAETTARGWEALPTLQDRTAFRSWIFRILNNTCFSERRTARNRAEHTPLDTVTEEGVLFQRLHQPFLLWWAFPEQTFLNRLLRADVARAIDALPDPFHDVVVLVDVQGLRYREVADLLGVPVGTVRSRLARGRRRLQEALWAHGVDAGLVPGSRHGSDSSSAGAGAASPHPETE
jgi:RNA polymerase sigma-70 factor, ECF subfamily